jgi:hypothetical protein
MASICTLNGKLSHLISANRNSAPILYQVRELIVVTRPDHPGVFGFGHDGTSNLCSISLPNNGPVSLRVFELLQFTLVGQEQAHLRS